MLAIIKLKDVFITAETRRCRVLFISCHPERMWKISLASGDFSFWSKWQKSFFKIITSSASPRLWGINLLPLDCKRAIFYIFISMTYLLVQVVMPWKILCSKNPVNCSEKLPIECCHTAPPRPLSEHWLPSVSPPVPEGIGLPQTVDSLGAPFGPNIYMRLLLELSNTRDSS